MVHDKWLHMTRCNHDDDIATFLRSVKYLFQCLRPEGSLRPLVEAAREARKLLFNAAKVDAPHAQLAKALATYTIGKHVLAKGLERSRAGLEDMASSTALYNATDKFEELAEGAITSPGTWLFEGNGGAPHNFESFREYIDNLNATTITFHGAVSRWSAAAMTDNAAALGATSDNFILILELGNYLFLWSVKRALAGMITKVFAEQHDPQHSDASGNMRDIDGDEPPLRIPTSATKLQPSGADNIADADINDDDAHGMRGKLTSELIKEFIDALHKFQPAGQSFAESMTRAFYNVNKCIKHFSQRVAPEPGDDDDWAVVFHRRNSNYQRKAYCINQLCNYMASYLHLLDAKQHDIDTFKAEIGTIGTSLNDSLQTFSKAHHANQFTKTVSFSISGDLCDHDVANELFEIVNMLFETRGANLYEFCMQASLGQASMLIQRNTITVTVVRENAIKGCSADKCLELLITAPPVASLLGNFSPNWVGHDADMQYFSTLEHNRALQHIQVCSEAVHLTELSLSLPDAACHTAQSAPISDALLALGVYCLSRDLANPAAVPHAELLVPNASAEHVQANVLCNKVACALKVLQTLLVKADSLLNSEQAIRFEQTGIRLLTSLASFRAWVKTLGIFTGRVLHTMLMHMATALTVSAEACKPATPSWAACFEDSQVLLKVASKMLGNKLPTVVHAHNDLHALLQELGGGCASRWRHPTIPRPRLDHRSDPAGHGRPQERQHRLHSDGLHRLARPLKGRPCRLRVRLRLHREAQGQGLRHHPVRPLGRARGDVGAWHPRRDHPSVAAVEERLH